MTSTLQGKVALITGAARGQGRNHAIRLAEAGADIIALDICEDIDGLAYPLATPNDLAVTVHAVEAVGQRIVARHADVRDPAQVAAVVGAGLAELGRLDIVCVNAGIIGPFEKSPDLADRVAMFRNVVDVNLVGAFCTIEATKQAVIDAGGGSVIITSSLVGLRASGAGGGYAESKHGLVGLMRCYAQELAPHMVRVNSIHPTNVDTPMIMNEATYRAFRPDLEHPTELEARAALQFLNLLPVPYIDVDDVSNVVRFLAGDDSRYITGVALPVDAGGAIK